MKTCKTCQHCKPERIFFFFKDYQYATCSNWNATVRIEGHHDKVTGNFKNSFESQRYCSIERSLSSGKHCGPEGKNWLENRKK